MGADGVLGRAGLLELALLGEREVGDLGQPSGRGRRVDPGRAQLVAIEGRALQQVCDLPAVRAVIRGELIGPGLRLGRRSVRQGTSSWGS
jgi:hypothetical protein